MPPRAEAVSSATTGGSASASGSASSAARPLSSTAQSASSAAGSSSWKATPSSSANWWWPTLVSAMEDLALYYGSSDSEWFPRLACAVAAVSSSVPTSASTPSRPSAPGSPASALPMPGSPASAFPSPGSPASAFPSPGSPASAFPSPGSPASAFPSPGSPASAFPSPGSPASAFPSPGSAALASSPVARSSRSSPAARSIPCAACKESKRGCRADCPTAIYFPPHQEPGVFEATKKLFNIKGMADTVTSLPTHQKSPYILSRVLKAYAWSLDPVLGLTGITRAVEAELVDMEGQLQPGNMGVQLAAEGSLLEQPQPSTSPSRQACGVCTYMGRECAPRCPLTKFFPTMDYCYKGRELFGTEGLQQLLKVLEERGLHAEDTPHRIDARAQERQADPVHGAVGLVCSLLGKHNGGGEPCASLGEDAAAFLRWMLQVSPTPPVASPDVPAAMTGGPDADAEALASARRSRCAACKVLQRKCTAICTYAPYFPVDRAQEFKAVRKVFHLQNIQKLLQSCNGEEPGAQMKAFVDTLIYEAGAHTRDPINGGIPYLVGLLIKLKEACEKLAAVPVTKDGLTDDDRCSKKARIE